MEPRPGDGADGTQAPPPDAAIPIARRIAAAPVFFPLWLRRRGGLDARLPMVGWFDPSLLFATA
jgi:hypothetical protein